MRCYDAIEIIPPTLVIDIESKVSIYRIQNVNTRNLHAHTERDVSNIPTSKSYRRLFDLLFIGTESNAIITLISRTSRHTTPTVHEALHHTTHGHLFLEIQETTVYCTNVLALRLFLGSMPALMCGITAGVPCVAHM